MMKWEWIKWVCFSVISKMNERCDMKWFECYESFLNKWSKWKRKTKGRAIKIWFDTLWFKSCASMSQIKFQFFKKLWFWLKSRGTWDLNQLKQTRFSFWVFLLWFKSVFKLESNHDHLFWKFWNEWMQLK